MKKAIRAVTLLAAILSVGTGLPVPGHAESEATHNPYHEPSWTDAQREIWQLIEAWNDAFSRNDAETYFTFIADEITVITPSNPYRVEGLPDDRQEFEFGVGRGYGKVSLFQEMQPLVRVYGDVAWATYFNRGYYGSDSGSMAYLKETDILRKIGDKWKIVHIHVSK